MQETWRTVAHTRSIVFKVQAAAEVHVELSEELGVTTKNALEVFLGSQENTISLIRRPSSDTVRCLFYYQTRLEQYAIFVITFPFSRKGLEL